MPDPINFPKHNPILRGLYIALVVSMIFFFGWLLLDPTALYYISEYQAPVVDFASCVSAGGLVESNVCYVSETEYYVLEKN